MPPSTLLCLGDSYTIGEGVPLHESFPYQLLQLLRAAGLRFQAPEIIAQTGWTTFELKDQIAHTILEEKYDLVTLLIGVNNQYRNLSAEDYQSDFEWLLHKAISLAGNQPENVIVISIPDWGVTPFAEGRDRATIATEIDAFNSINESLSAANHVHYVNITPGTREAANDESLLAADKLHYSAKEHRRWAELVLDNIVSHKGN
jgi:lysophospholipase L1-like esterase